MSQKSGSRCPFIPGASPRAPWGSRWTVRAAQEPLARLQRRDAGDERLAHVGPSSGPRIEKFERAFKADAEYGIGAAGDSPAGLTVLRSGAGSAGVLQTGRDPADRGLDQALGARARSFAEEPDLEERQGIHVGVAELDGALQFGLGVQEPVVPGDHRTSSVVRVQLLTDRRTQVGAAAAGEVGLGDRRSALASESSAFSIKEVKNGHSRDIAQASGPPARAEPPPRVPHPGRTTP